MKNNSTTKNLLYLIAIVLVVSCTKEDNSGKRDSNNEALYRSTIPIPNISVQIDNQIWMVKNLSVSRYRNGDLIPQVQDQTQWSNLTSGAWCYYDNNSINGRVYGKLYNWYAVNDSRGIAPLGWHVPSDTEWAELVSRNGGPLNAGKGLRATILWNLGSGETTNSSGFTGLPAGYRDASGYFATLGSSMHFWTSSESDLNTAWFYYGNNANNNIDRYNPSKNYGFSIRCIKNN